MRRIALLATIVAAVGCGGSDNNTTSNTFTANLTTGNEPTGPGFGNPAPNAKGTATVTINANNTITYSLRATGLSAKPTVAHIHLTPGGTAPAQGPVIVPFNVSNAGQPVAADSVTVDDTVTSFPPAGTQDPDNPGQALTADRVIQLIRAGRTYANIHTAINTGGEIRGDLKAQ